MHLFQKPFKFLLILCIFYSAACTQKNEDEKLMVLNAYLEDDVKTLDPAVAYDHISWDVIPNIFETLYQYSYLALPFEVEPLLAADMPTFSKDKLTVTIPLRKGVYFRSHSVFKNKKRELIAEDFIYSFKRLAVSSIQSQGAWIFEGKVLGYSEFKDALDKAKTKEDKLKVFQQPIEGFQAIDSHTLQIKLTKNYPQILYILTMPFTAALAKEAVEAFQDENWNIHTEKSAIGTGPFILTKWTRNHEIILEKNPEFRDEIYPKNANVFFEQKGFLQDAGKKIPFLDKVVIKTVKEQQPAWLMFQRGQIDFLQIPKDNFTSIISDRETVNDEMKKKGMELAIDTGTSFYFLSFNLKMDLFAKNKALRQAISSAINREQFIELFTNNTGLLMNHALPPGILGRNDKTELKYNYNLERAKKLMEKAGYPEGKGLPVIQYDTRKSSSEDRQIADFIQKSLAEIGVKINVNLNTFPTFLEKTKQSNVELFMDGWITDYPDAENVYQLLYGPNKSPGPNNTNMDNAQFNQLYLKIAQMEPGTERTHLIEQVEDFIQEEVPWVYIYHRANYRLYQKWLKNFRGSQMIPATYKYFRLDQPEKVELLKLRN